jgi:two-component system response regulator GlrR
MRAKSDQTKGKILLVDDDPGLLRLLSIRLRAEEFDVVAVESAHDALGSLNRFSPDLVITDLRMDKMDGIGLLKELQTRSPGLRVIIITAHGTIPDAVTATQHGAFGFLTKPIDKDELLSLVERALKVSGTVDVEEDWAAEIITRNGPTHAFSSRVKAARARNCSPRQFTVPARATIDRSRLSIARPWPKTCSSRNYSGTKRAPSPARHVRTKASSRLPRAAR